MLFAGPCELLILIPADLAELRTDQLHIVSVSKESNGLLDQLWRAVRAPGGAKNCAERTVSSIYVCGGWDASQIAGVVTVASAEESEFGRSFSSHAAELGLTLEEGDPGGPRAKLRKKVETASSNSPKYEDPKDCRPLA